MLNDKVKTWLFAVIIVVIALLIGALVFTSAADENSKYCDEKYGEDNWTLELNNASGTFGESYTCVPKYVNED